jgi:hypothetical protein
VAIVSVKVDKDGRASGFDLTGLRRYTVVYKVVTDNVEHDSLWIINAADIPRPWQPYHGDASATCRRLDPRQTDDPRIWLVTAEFSNEYTPQRDGSNVARDYDQIAPLGQGPTGGAGGLNPGGGPIGATSTNDPLNRLPEVRWGHAFIREAAYTDGNGVAFAASNKEPFLPPLEGDVTIPVLHVTRNEAYYFESVAQDYMNSVNKDPFLGAAKYQALCKNIGAEQQFHNGTAYARVSYEFWFRTDRDYGWQKKVKDEGTYELVMVDGVPSQRLNRDEFGHPIPTPVALDGAGRKLAQPFADYRYLYFLPYRLRKFNKLKIRI